MDDWASTVTGWATKALDAAIAVKVNNPHELNKMQLQMYGNYGFYPDAQGNYGNQPIMGAAGGISPVVLIGGAAVLLVLLLKD
ncbi:hypothetical protein SAMN05216428_102444 [Nitrosospira sp. Nsp11]|uniref:hypothetical protein n=1 Tax=Nitrosospira sp. Nsp11 TaxID=1855338 RepID=UPI00090F8F25|nr:hypothetical protein [Nitrosospira sp. Nsp11]SHL45104.1 hypothetical protein SAMN05216428_102444 [Nitrosospira sp. Nsp11]